MAVSGFLALWTWLAPGLAFLILSLIVPLRRSGKPAAWLSIVISLAALVGAVSAWRATVPDMARRMLWDWIPVEDGVLTSVGVLVDADATLMLVLVALVSFLVQVYSLGYLADEPPASLGRYYTYQSLFAFSMMGIVLAPNFVQLFICWELVGLCSYLLIGYWYPRPEAARAAVKAFWITKAGDAFFLIGIVMLWSRTGTFDFSELFELAVGGGEALAGLGLVTFFIYLGAAGKSAQFPFHVWLPDAMEGPTPVSALIHAATMVTAGVYLLFRTAFLFQQTPDVLAAVGWIGAFTALLAATLACVQTDIKRVLAYSTVSQLGYMMAAIGAGFASAGFLHLLTHGVFKALLFLAAGAVIHAVGSNDIHAMGGLARRMPQTFIVFLVGTLSLAGIPVLRGLLLQGGDPGRDLDGRAPGALRDAGAGRLPHRLLHVPGGVHRVPRRPRGRAGRPRRARRGARPRRADDHDAAALDPGLAGDGHRHRLLDLAPRRGVRGARLAHAARGRRSRSAASCSPGSSTGCARSARTGSSSASRGSARPRWSGSGWTISSR